MIFRRCRISFYVVNQLFDLKFTTCFIERTCVHVTLHRFSFLLFVKFPEYIYKYNRMVDRIRCIQFSFAVEVIRHQELVILYFGGHIEHIDDF